jgi:hypothetical protein
MTVEPRLTQSDVQIVKHIRFLELCGAIQECQELSAISGEPKCMILEGRSGVGKTTLVKHYAEEYGRRATDVNGELRVLYLLVPSPVTVKALIIGMLDQLGAATDRSRVLYDQRIRLVHFLKSLGVELIILDEFQHLLQHSGSSRTEVSDFIKNLIKESGIPFLLVGIQGYLDDLLKGNNQLARLFSRRENLGNFPLGDAGGNNQFAVFVDLALEATKVKIEGLDQREFNRRAHYCTDGVVAAIMDLLNGAKLAACRTATREASEGVAFNDDGYVSVAPEHLSDAFCKAIRPINDCRDLFQEDPSKRANIPRMPPTREEPPKGNQKKAGRPRGI